MKLEIQRVNQKINKIEELMTTFLEQVSKNSLQVGNPSLVLVSSPASPSKVIKLRHLVSKYNQLSEFVTSKDIPY